MVERFAAFCQKRKWGSAELGFFLFIVVLVIGAIVFISVVNHRYAERERNTITASGRIESVREVFKPGGWGLADKSVYITIAGEEYKIAEDLNNDYIKKGQEMQFTHYKGTIKEISVTRDE